ncbi:chitinase [Leuconostoc sp. UCMA20149]|uniref:chitinase n=1 Tax=Leuconostoc sp. UCMA20149 TaxID=2583528 RepID=UPI0025B1BDE7|nr:chitinase [Leuconostoc sp. UCMA20149]MDN2450173.1 chitinase [Leuconostoc sp. UCMA20149]
MTVYTKTITAGLALLLAGSPLVGTVSADNIANSNGTVSFSDQDGSLVLASADNVTFQNQDLSNISDFTPDASNGTTGKVTLEQTSANPSGTYSIQVQQTGDWNNSYSNTMATAEALPIMYNSMPLSSPVTFVDSAAAPARGVSTKAFNHDSKSFALDLSGTGDLSNALDQSLLSELTWTLTNSVE